MDLRRAQQGEECAVPLLLALLCLSAMEALCPVCPCRSPCFIRLP